MNNRMKTKITAQDIADYLISYAQSKDIKITPLEVQKYLFYAQGWHLAVSDSVLFDDKFEAWTHGPVIKKIYGRFKKFERNNIDEKI
ncbi:MAG TPA: type II toxin-antitoxin system antitoxin SocA domain-containing protein, partial [bacterium]